MNFLITISNTASLSAPVPLCCLGVVGFKNVVESVFVIKPELHLVQRLRLQQEAQQGLTLQGGHVLHGDTTERQTSRHSSEELTDGRADLAGGVRVQDLVFDDKPQPLPVLFTALWPLQVPTHGGICARRHLEDGKIMMMYEVVVAQWQRSIAALERRLPLSTPPVFSSASWWKPEEFYSQGSQTGPGHLTMETEVVKYFDNFDQNTRTSERIYCSVAGE